MLLLDEFDADEELPWTRDQGDPFRRVMDLVCLGQEPHQSLAIYWGNERWGGKGGGPLTDQPGTLDPMPVIGSEAVVVTAIRHLESDHDGVPEELLSAVELALGLGSGTEALRMLVGHSDSMI